MVQPTKSEYITLCALLIAAPLFTQMGSKLWLSETINKKKKKVKKSMAGRVDFGEYMKLWRFKELKLLLPRTMEDEAKKSSDDWWRI